MTESNMKLWNSVDKTDPSATKTANVNGQQMTSIIGQYMFMRATEQFGPYGIGWWCEVVKEEYVTGAKIMSGEKGDIHVGDNIMHTMRLRLCYQWEGKEGRAEHVGCTPFVYKSKYGATTDMEAPKKTFTDGVKKCLSMLGVSADVFMGLFDDRDYVEEIRSQVELEKAEDKDAEAERQRQERLQWLEIAVKELGAAPTIGALKTMHAKYVRDATRRGEENFVKRLARAFDERTTALQHLADKEAKE